MSLSTVAWIAAAVLLFWTVGAYNRLVRLRQSVARRFALVDEQFRARQALLLRLAESAEPAELLRAACGQAEAAFAHARPRPASVGAITSLRLAEDILTEARGRLQAPQDAALQAELAAADSTLVFAKRQFNDAVEAYNQAVRQFPTWIVAGPFGFRRAATL